MHTFIQLVICGIAIGLIYALAALGVVIVYKATKILNLAPGGLLIISAYLARMFLVRLHFPVVLAIVASAISVAPRSPSSHMRYRPQGLRWKPDAASPSASASSGTDAATPPW